MPRVAYYLLPVILGLLAIQVLILYQSKETYLDAANLILPTNGTKLQTPVPLKKGRLYTIDISSPDSLIPVYAEWYEEPSFLAKLFGGESKYHFESDILIDESRKFAEDHNTHLVSYKYWGSGNPLVIRLAKDDSSILGTAQVSIRSESLLEQWDRRGAPSWFWVLASVVALSLLARIFYDLYLYLEKKQTRMSLEKQQKRAKGLREKAKELKLRAESESYLLDPEKRKRYAHAKRHEIIDTPAQDTYSPAALLNELSIQYKIITDLNIELTHFKSRHPALFRALGQAVELKDKKPVSLKHHWFDEYRAIMLDEAFVSLLQKEYPVVLDWLEARQEVVRLAEMNIAE